MGCGSCFWDDNLSLNMTKRGEAGSQEEGIPEQLAFRKGVFCEKERERPRHTELQAMTRRGGFARNVVHCNHLEPFFYNRAMHNLEHTNDNHAVCCCCRCCWERFRLLCVVVAGRGETFAGPTAATRAHVLQANLWLQSDARAWTFLFLFGCCLLFYFWPGDTVARPTTATRPHLLQTHPTAGA